jgi:transcriptional regulator of arginine metabolism
MNKSSRHIAIRQIITQRAIASQDELCDALRESGFDITQATLSRDLKELGIARINAPEGPRYVAHGEGGEESRLKALLGYEVTSIDANESLILIKTLAGRAQGVAEILDHMKIPGILGTLAGDNTIFVAPRSTKQIAEVVRSIQEMIAG